MTNNNEHLDRDIAGDYAKVNRIKGTFTKKISTKCPKVDDKEKITTLTVQYDLARENWEAVLGQWSAVKAQNSYLRPMALDAGDTDAIPSQYTMVLDDSSFGRKTVKDPATEAAKQYAKLDREGKISFLTSTGLPRETAEQIVNADS